MIDESTAGRSEATSIHTGWELIETAMHSACILGAIVAALLNGDALQAGRRSLRCTPAVVTAQDVLEFRFDGPHGDELGVRTPDGRFLFVAFEQETAGSVPPIASARFKSMRSFELDVGTAKGLESISGGSPQPLFEKAGKYQFVVSENL